MHTFNKPTLLFAIGLSAVAGYVDAIGFLEMGRIFVSFMSGNSTQLAVGLSQGDMPHALLLGGVIACFVTGAALGTATGHFVSQERRVSAVLTLVAILLAVASACYTLYTPGIAILFIAVAMGAENAVFQRAGEISVGLTYMTGALAKLGQKLMNAALGGDRYAWVPYLLLWIGLITGGITGALAYGSIGGMHGLWLAAAWVALWAIMATRQQK